MRLEDGGAQMRMSAACSCMRMYGLHGIGRILVRARARIKVTRLLLMVKCARFARVCSKSSLIISVLYSLLYYP